MTSLIKKFAPALPVAAILAILVSVSGSPLTQSRSQELATGSLSRQSGQPKVESVRHVNVDTGNVQLALQSLNSARLNLLQQAAQDGDDAEGLRAASKSYRDSIVQMRDKIGELAVELGPDDAYRMAGMMMSQTAAITQRVLYAEIFYHLEQRTDPEIHE